VKETNAIIKIYDGAKSISSSLPTVEKVDESLLEKLQGNVESGDTGEHDDNENQIDAPEEELLGTNKNLFLNTNNSLLFNDQKNEEKSGSSESSEGGEDDPNSFLSFFNSMPKTVIQNQPKNNPFLKSVEPTPTPSTGGSFFPPSNNNDNNIFGGKTVSQTTNNSPFGVGNNTTNFTTPFGGTGNDSVDTSIQPTNNATTIPTHKKIIFI